MHHYPHHIGDFNCATRHLTRIERSIYRDLIELYYDTEQPLQKDIAALCRKIVARSEEEKAAVLGILDEFFVDTPAGWYHDRCEQELDNFRKSNTQKAAAGRASAAAKAARREQALNANPTTVERPLNDRTTNVEIPLNGTPTNQEPRTKNQEPIKNPPIPPEGANTEPKKKERGSYSLKTYLHECKEKGLQPIPSDDSVFDYAEKAGISHDVLALHWHEFLDRYTMDGAKKYKAWRTVFGKSVRGNWFRLWYFDNNGVCTLTTLGVQAKNAAARKAA